MKVLLQACCGPCAIVPVAGLRDEGIRVSAVYANPNIHPFTEWDRRREALAAYAAAADLHLLPGDDYDPQVWFRAVTYREPERCRICYHLRLSRVAHLARRGRFDAFSTTLLYSRYQRHDLIRELGEAVGRELGVPFLYRDWRSGWEQGVAASRSMGLYRQGYCGCLYSEGERYGSKRKKPP